jgi:hypothetical protein
MNEKKNLSSSRIERKAAAKRRSRDEETQVGIQIKNKKKRKKSRDEEKRLFFEEKTKKRKNL